MEAPKIKEWVLSIGNAYDGLTLVGPFGDAEEAAAWAEDNERNLPWEVVPVYEP